MTRSTSTRGRWTRALLLQGLALVAFVGLAGMANAASGDHPNRGRGLACGHVSAQVSPPASPQASPQASRPSCPPQAGPKKPKP